MLIALHAYAFAVLDNLIQQLGALQSLSTAQIAAAVNALTTESVSVESKAAFLTALAKKGEAADEIGSGGDGLDEQQQQLGLDQALGRSASRAMVRLGRGRA